MPSHSQPRVPRLCPKDGCETELNPPAQRCPDHAAEHRRELRKAVNARYNRKRAALARAGRRRDVASDGQVTLAPPLASELRRHGALLRRAAEEFRKARQARTEIERDRDAAPDLAEWAAVTADNRDRIIMAMADLEIAVRDAERAFTAALTPPRPRP